MKFKIILSLFIVTIIVALLRYTPVGGVLLLSNKKQTEPSFVTESIGNTPALSSHTVEKKSISHSASASSRKAKMKMPDNAGRTPIRSEYDRSVAADDNDLADIHARIEVAGKSSQNLLPNELGIFPRVLASAGEKIPVAITYEDGEPGDSVVVQVVDGGGLDDGVMAKVLHLNNSKSVAFTAGMSMQDGIHRVSLLKGGERKMLEFWVGAEPAVSAN